MQPTDLLEPEWLATLRSHAKAHRQRQAAKDIGYSGTVVNQVLKGTYTGDLKAVQAKVEGALMGAMVECPVIGEMPRNRCVEHQARSRNFATTNPLRVRLAKVCPTCPNRRSQL